VGGAHVFEAPGPAAGFQGIVVGGHGVDQATILQSVDDYPDSVNYLAIAKSDSLAKLGVNLLKFAVSAQAWQVTT
jgi:hypothetical protein